MTVRRLQLPLYKVIFKKSYVHPKRTDTRKIKEKCTVGPVDGAVVLWSLEEQPRATESQLSSSSVRFFNKDSKL